MVAFGTPVNNELRSATYGAFESRDQLRKLGRRSLSADLSPLALKQISASPTLASGNTVQRAGAPSMDIEADEEDTLWYAWIHKRGEITHRYQPRLFLLVQEPDSLVDGESDAEDAPPIIKLYYFKGDPQATPSVPTRANCKVAGLKYCADCDLSRATVFTGAEENTLRIVTWDKTWQLRCDHKSVSAAKHPPPSRRAPLAPPGASCHRYGLARAAALCPKQLLRVVTNLLTAAVLPAPFPLALGSCSRLSISCLPSSKWCT